MKLQTLSIMIWIAAFPATVAVATGQNAPTNAQKKRVIVDPFDYSAVVTPEQTVWGTAQNVGRGIRAMFITRAQQAAKVIIVERGDKEQQAKNERAKNLSSDMKQGTGARNGRGQGADAILAGDITIFGRDDKTTRVTGSGTVASIMDKLHRKDDENRAIVAINYRLVDAETLEVIASGEARGEAIRKGKKTSFWGAAGQSVTGMDINTTNSNFAQTLVGEATQDCIDKLAAVLNEQAASMKKTLREVETTVVDVTGNTLTIGAGESDGVNVGETFDILRVLSVFKDPITHEVLDKKTEPVGRMTVTSVRPRVATGAYVGSEPKATADFMAIKRLPQQQ